MPRNIDLFIAAATPLDELAATIAARAGLTATARPEGGFVLLDGHGAAAVLAEHSHPDDGDLRLSRYRYSLAATTERADHVMDAPETRMLRTVAAALSGVCDVLLVLDLQYRPPVATG